MRYRLWLCLALFLALVPSVLVVQHLDDSPDPPSTLAAATVGGDPFPGVDPAAGLSAPLAFTRAVALNAWWGEVERQGVWWAEVERQAVERSRAQHRAQSSARSTAPAPEVSRETPATRSGGSCGGWLDLIASLWPVSQVATACRVMMCESGGNPRAYNRSGATGLFQLLGHGGTFDPVQNATVAFHLWERSGWGPWVCR